MTEQDFKDRLQDIDRRNSILQEEKRQVIREYVAYMNSQKEQFMDKKVKVKYFDYGRKEKEASVYWGGFAYEWGDIKPIFFKVKKDGTKSLQHASIYCRSNEFTLEEID